MARLTSEQMQDLVEQFGEVKLTRKELNLIRALLNHTTTNLVNEYNNKTSKSFQVALSQLSELNHSIADYQEEVNPNFKRDIWFDSYNRTSNARQIW